MRVTCRGLSRRERLGGGIASRNGSAVNYDKEDCGDDGRRRRRRFDDGVAPQGLSYPPKWHSVLKKCLRALGMLLSPRGLVRGLRYEGGGR